MEVGHTIYSIVLAITTNYAVTINPLIHLTDRQTIHFTWVLVFTLSQILFMIVLDPILANIISLFSFVKMVPCVCGTCAGLLF